jgi:hypothetical protein
MRSILETVISMVMARFGYFEIMDGIVPHLPRKAG